MTTEDTIRRHCEQSRAGYFYCRTTDGDPCGGGPHPHTYCTAERCLPAIRHGAIRSEAEVWLHGDTDAAARMFAKAVEFARLQDADGRRYWSAGYWHSNQLLERAAVTSVQIELGEPAGWHGGPARLNPVAS
jgi:hypothetical protein